MKKYRITETIDIVWETEAKSEGEARMAYIDHIGNPKNGNENFLKLSADASSEISSEEIE